MNKEMNVKTWREVMGFSEDKCVDSNEDTNEMNMDMWKLLMKLSEDDYVKSVVDGGKKLIIEVNPDWTFDTKEVDVK